MELTLSSGPKPSNQVAADRVKFQEAFEHHLQGRLTRADVLYGELLASTPDHFDALHFRGVLLQQTGRHVEALEMIKSAIALDSGQAAAHSNLGVVYRSLGQSGDALDSFDRALTLDSQSAESWANRGNALCDLKRFDEALASLDRALLVNPRSVDARLHRARTLVALHRLEEALADFDRALEINPENSGSHSDRGGVLIEMKLYEESLVALNRALALNPDNAAALSNRGAALVELKRQGDALTSLDRALELDPFSASALFNRGTALRDLRRPQEAAQSYARLLAIDPDYPYAAGFLFNSKRSCWDWEGHAQGLARLERDVLDGRRVDAPFSFLAVSSSPAAQLKCAQTWVADKCPSTEGFEWHGGHGAKNRHTRIRLAYLSADFGEHPVAFSIAGLLEIHDRSKFEVYGLSFGPEDQSEIRARLKKAVDRFMDVRDKSDNEIARMMRAMEIDIAVDLSGYTQGNRAAVFAQRPAPVQVNYLGFSGSTGAAHMDYIVADAHVIPTGDDSFYAEKVVRLPLPFLVNDRARVIAAQAQSRADAGLPPDGFVFCCFNNSFKITPAAFDIWMRLLDRVERSVLWLYEQNSHAADNLRREAGRRGIEPQRIVFAHRTPLLADHLARYRLADLFVDTLPYNAHVTAVDALWAGLPVLTCTGRTFAGRVAGSLLHALGLPELVTESPGAYEALAMRLAVNPAELGGIKSRLAANLATHPLFDTDKFRRHIEAAYECMHDRRLRGLQPEGFSVAPIG